MPTRPSLHKALQLELGRSYRDQYQAREDVRVPKARWASYLKPSHDSSLTFSCNLYLRQSFQASCYARGIPYTERIRQLMLTDLAEHPVE